MSCLHNLAEDSTGQANWEVGCWGLHATTRHYGCPMMMMMMVAGTHPMFLLVPTNNFMHFFSHKILQSFLTNFCLEFKCSKLATTFRHRPWLAYGYALCGDLFYSVRVRHHLFNNCVRVSFITSCNTQSQINTGGLRWNSWTIAKY